MAASCDTVECDGRPPLSSRREKQSGVEVSPDQLPKVLETICSKAYQPSDDCEVDNDGEKIVHTALLFTETSIVSRTSIPSSDYTNKSVQASSASGQVTHSQYQHLVPNTQTRTNSQTINNGSSATQTNSCGTSSVPKYPNFSTVPQRLASFGSVILSVSTQLLSLAGFFLVRNGGEDATRCHHCGIGLRHWSADDDPWVEHARFSPKCGYLLNVKGQEFVNLIQLAVQYSNTPANSTSNQLGNAQTSTNSNALQQNVPTRTRQELVRENAELRNITMCMYCYNSEVSLVFLPCGHLISCEGCGQQQRICRICDSSIKGTVRTFRT